MRHCLKKIKTTRQLDFRQQQSVLSQKRFVLLVKTIQKRGAASDVVFHDLINPCPTSSLTLDGFTSNTLPPQAAATTSTQRE